MNLQRDPRLTVLVVDDESGVRRACARAIAVDKRVMRVLEASDAATALHLIHEYGDAVDAIFLDIEMPGMDGLGLARILRSMPHSPEIIFVSAHDRAISAYEVSAIDYLVKPFSVERIYESIGRVQATRRSGNATRNPEHGQVFLCHSSQDRDQVRNLYGRLTSDGVGCWFDEMDLLPGQDWESEINSAIRNSKYVLACLSQGSITKRGYLQRELKKALDVADEQPEGAVFLIPVRLEECAIRSCSALGGVAMQRR